MTVPFLQLEASEISAWRELSITRAFTQYLDLEEARVADGIVMAVGDDRIADAKLLYGKLEAIQELKGAILRDRQTENVEVEDDFVDPAALRT